MCVCVYIYTYLCKYIKFFECLYWCLCMCVCMMSVCREQGWSSGCQAWQPVSSPTKSSHQPHFAFNDKRAWHHTVHALFSRHHEDAPQYTEHLLVLRGGKRSIRETPLVSVLLWELWLFLSFLWFLWDTALISPCPVSNALCFHTCSALLLTAF